MKYTPHVLSSVKYIHTESRIRIWNYTILPTAQQTVADKKCKAWAEIKKKTFNVYVHVLMAMIKVGNWQTIYTSSLFLFAIKKIILKRLSYGMLRHVVWKKLADVSEMLTASIIKGNRHENLKYHKNYKVFLTVTKIDRSI